MGNILRTSQGRSKLGTSKERSCMKELNKKLPIALLTGVATVAVLGANFASAQTSGETLVDRISSKFNLNKAEVQQVFDEVHDEKEAERTQDMSERLQEKVDAGTITAEQKTLIETKLKEQQEKMEAIRDEDLTEDARHEKMSALRDELRQWAEDNDLDFSLVMSRGGKGGMRGGEGMGRF